MENARIADALDEIADLIELQEGSPFRVRSYRMAAQSVRDQSQRVADLLAQGQDLSELPHIGQRTAGKIRELVDTGTCARLEELRRQVPEELPLLLRIPRLGPRKIMKLHQALGVRTIEDLKRAAMQHRVRGLHGMGAKEEENILAGIATIESASGRMLYRAAADQVALLGRHLDGVAAIAHWEVAGSFRRRQETVGDLDILIQAGADARAAATEGILACVDIDEVPGEVPGEVLARGEERLSVRLRHGLQVDFRFCEPDRFGAALLYFTGSKAHNIAIRKRAQQRGWKLSEYGLFAGSRGHAGERVDEHVDEHVLEAATEEAIYERLGMCWIPPELREDRGEVEAAEQGALPALVTLGDIRGDLHAHTTATDGAATVEDMARAAQDRGYEYLAITDHSKAVRVAGGLDEERMRRHADHIREVDAAMGKGFWLLAGVEVDILESGALDLDEDLLAGLDWVVASVHYHRNMDAKRMTERLVRAAQSGVVHCLGHPLGRLIGKREPLVFDLEAVFAACREHGVWLEIDAQPERMDLPDAQCKRARELGLGFVIDSDAHAPANFDFMAQGVDVARRGWLEKRDVLNTRGAAALRRALARRGARA